MYAVQLPAEACVRLLNATSPVGCAAKANTVTAGALALFDQPSTAEGLQAGCRHRVQLISNVGRAEHGADMAFHAGQKVLIVPQHHLASCLKEWQQERTIASAVSAILVLPGDLKLTSRFMLLGNNHGLLIIWHHHRQSSSPWFFCKMMF